MASGKTSVFEEEGSLKLLKHKDVISGFFLLALGLSVVVASFIEYRIGSFSRMGPGLFPVIVGSLLALLGFVVLIVPLLKRSGSSALLPSIEPRPFFVILAAIGTFAIVIEYFGLIPAVIMVTFISAMAHSSTTLLITTVVAVVISASAAILFRGLLQIPLDLFSWPFQ